MRALLSQNLVVALAKILRRLVLRIYPENVVDLKLGFARVPGVLCCTRQLESDRGQTLFGLARLGLHSRTDSLHQHPGIIVELGCRGEVTPLLCHQGIGQLLA